MTTPDIDTDELAEAATAVRTGWAQSRSGLPGAWA